MGALTRAVRNVSRRKMRALLVIIALGFSMAIMISIPAGIVANQEATQTLATNFNSTMTNMQLEINKTSTLIECRTSSGSGFSPSGQPDRPGFGSQQSEVFENETIIEEILSIEGVKDVVPYLEKASNETTTEIITGPGGREFTITRSIYTIEGVCLNSKFIHDYSILPTNMTSGRNLREGDSGVVLLSSNLTSYYGMKVNESVDINGEPFIVIGVYEPSGQARMQMRVAIMNLSEAQTVTGLTGKVSRLDVYANSTSYVDEIADVIKAAYTNLTVTTYKDRLQNLENMQTMYTQTVSNAQTTLSQTQSLATQEILIAVAATSLIVLFVMLYTVRERTKEIGTLKAIGFSGWNVMSQFVLEGILISFIAGVVGIAIGSVGAPFLSSLLLPHVSLFGGSQSDRFRPSGLGTTGIAESQATTAATLDPQLILLAFGASILLGALGSLYPAWRASRIRPAEAMRYE